MLRKQHIVVTTYDTIKSEYSSFNPAAKNESKASSSKKKANKDSDDDSDSDPRTVKKRSKNASKKCALYGVKWFRIVLGMCTSAYAAQLHCLLDEAHNIKNVKTKGAIACCELQGKFRWCLTGTPMFVFSLLPCSSFINDSQAKQCHGAFLPLCIPAHQTSV